MTVVVGVVEGPTPVEPPESAQPPAMVERPAAARPVGAARPVRLRIPSIDVAARVVRLGLNPDRTVEVPTDAETTGWYHPGPAPGDLGSAVILGHVDSATGPAVFYRLRQLARGDRIAVDAADGSTEVFRVLRLATYPNAHFPAQEVYASGGGGRRLNLVTCGGTFDPQDGYQANLVVFTRRVQRSPAHHAAQLWPPLPG
jgi:hypothetical protein